MRAVTSATAAAVLGIERKTLDNLLVRLGPDFLPPGRQGIERRIPVAALAELFLVASLAESLRVPARRALELARDPTGGAETTGGLLRIAVDRAGALREVEERLSLAIETVVRPRRGRPRRRSGR